jgi:hypothetical protein
MDATYVTKRERRFAIAIDVQKSCSETDQADATKKLAEATAGMLTARASNVLRAQAVIIVDHCASKVSSRLTLAPKTILFSQRLTLETDEDMRLSSVRGSASPIRVPEAGKAQPGNLRWNYFTKVVRLSSLSHDL